ncbi:GntR family transcriptional regulator [Saccharopolyspora subtropica]|uniref:GntR family transcriptional regulator n=1 Tax=Saccharopolyspora thermophila TaxID=89367 RepID=A0A917JZT6_9PSEU|nr:FadR/GntR family transcriptional regulator [Saccharopolyspora subtropica]GGI91795.1 GntR family transcriptional regulator [Saccharopolyspora subtropica]
MASSQPPNAAGSSTEFRAAAPDRPPRLPEVVAERLQQDLLAQDLRPGDRLPTESQLVERYGVSRTVIREAGRILEQRGLVDIRPGRGMTVAAPDGSAIVQHYSLMLGMNAMTFQQLMETRLIIEVEVAALAALRRTDEDLADMRASLERAQARADDYQVCLEEDMRFHEIVTRASGNPFFSWFMDPVNTCLRESYQDSSAYLASLPQTFAEHRAILDAIAAGDPDAARRSAREHLNRVVSQQDALVSGRKPR